MSNRENERAKAKREKRNRRLARFEWAKNNPIYVRVPFGFEIAEPKPWKGGAP